MFERSQSLRLVQCFPVQFGLGLQHEASGLGVYFKASVPENISSWIQQHGLPKDDANKKFYEQYNDYVQMGVVWRKGVKLGWYRKLHEQGIKLVCRASQTTKLKCVGKTTSEGSVVDVQLSSLDSALFDSVGFRVTPNDRVSGISDSLSIFASKRWMYLKVFFIVLEVEVRESQLVSKLGFNLSGVEVLFPFSVVEIDANLFSKLSILLGFKLFQKLTDKLIAWGRRQNNYRRKLRRLRNAFFKTRTKHMKREKKCKQFLEAFVEDKEEHIKYFVVRRSVKHKYMTSAFWKEEFDKKDAERSEEFQEYILDYTYSIKVHKYLTRKFPSINSDFYYLFPNESIKREACLLIVKKLNNSRFGIKKIRLIGMQQ